MDLSLGLFLIIINEKNAPFLRSLPLSLGSLGIGFQQTFLRFLGTIPSSAVFGRLIDASCVLWNTNECTGEVTSCIEYNNKYFR